MEKLLGASPQIIQTLQWNGLTSPGSQNADRSTPPKWDGQNAAKRWKGWLRELRMWRQTTSHPVHIHGHLLYKSFDDQTWLQTCAERVMESDVLSVNRWGLIFREVLIPLKPYLDIEADVLIEELLLHMQCEAKETMTAYPTRERA